MYVVDKVGDAMGLLIVSDDKLLTGNQLYLTPPIAELPIRA